ncbi:MAG: hypothetical protein Q8S54_00260 [Bacteroidota bacterium]|nr:hypothetical protein [Odoribacter sp.]MDP3641601.1 hypothetical protein [Bacteroidota bacterium]
MKTKTIALTIILTMGITLSQFVGTKNYFHPEFSENENSNGMAFAYPPGVGILSKSKNCLSCHINNGSWGDESNNIIDIIDKDTKKSLKQTDGSFQIEVNRFESKTVLTVIGRKVDDKLEMPYRNAWIYIDPKTIQTNSLSKFAPGWECNLQMACRVVGDKLDGFENATITSLPMTIRPSDAAQNSELSLQVMLTKGESQKGNAKEGMKGNYFEKRVMLKVVDKP